MEAHPSWPTAYANLPLHAQQYAGPVTGALLTTKWTVGGGSLGGRGVYQRWNSRLINSQALPGSADRANVVSFFVPQASSGGKCSTVSGRGGLLCVALLASLQRFLNYPTNPISKTTYLHGAASSLWSR